ncbi:leucine-rich repeat protein [Fadolivirus algeromassiliense]|jgi:Leucine-rich repeat (LRR) protein|uniref:Leucine-rich repeat protein n=1 Tax=Fadolivirus FV1/VV64 TaxID=3070911 RepID=A0A7D3QVP7_9VIRU|nr:leucine-rich repeat protein [Fadolivirus algeromassiliense]QKF93759.1 leucine-rich repeat protein [Fadolivirus FV1/VV64]
MNNIIDTETAKEYEYKLNDKRLIKMHRDKHISIYGDDSGFKNSILITGNDLKYKSKNYNDIDIKRLKDKSDDKDLLEYRLNECKNNNYSMLDLSHLGLKKLPDLPKKITDNVNYLFLNENEFSHIDDLSIFKELIVLDLCENNLTTLPILPEKIEELLIKHNYISSIDELSQCDYLKRLDCSNNTIKKIPMIDSLEILRCDQNVITEIPRLINIIKLSCSDNQLKNLNDMPYVEIIDCEKNFIETIEGYKNLKELYCNKTNVNCIRNLPKLEVLHCYKSNFTQLEYIQTLKELLCDYRDDLVLSKFYTIINSDVFKNSIVLIEFK